MVVRKQVITIDPATGAISGLQTKPGNGIDLSKLGKATIKRASEVLWDSEKQQWYVEMKPLQGNEHFEVPRVINKLMYHVADKNIKFDQYICSTTMPIAYFDTYDHAVNAEITVLDYLRQKGIYQAV